MRSLAAALAAIALLSACGQAPARTEKPPLLFLSSLPVLFGEHLSIEAPASPLRDALERDYRIAPIAIADDDSLERGRLLLMAQPRAQPAEALVALDRWVRGGGRLLLLADPLLEWPTAKGLGDPTGPTIAFADTGLLGHWGLTLYRPDPGQTVGSFATAPGGTCVLVEDAVVARCAIGRGFVTVIADADFVRDEAGPGRVVEELQKLSGRQG